jgi:transcriptional regulator with XRE-family HTH domain
LYSRRNLRRPVGYPENPRSLAEHLLKWRKERGLLQRDAAARMAVRLDTYITWEHGRRRPSIGHVPTIVRQLGYDPSQPTDGPVGEIESARRCLGWSLRKTSAFLGIDQGTLARWNAGASFPDFAGDRIDRFLALPTQHINEEKNPPGSSASWTVGQHLRFARSERGLTRRELASLVGSCSNSILNWERDRQLPEVQFWPAIIQFLGRDPMPIAHTFAEKIEQQRRRLGWTYAETAQFINVDVHTVLRWKNGGRMMQLRRAAIDELIRLARGSESRDRSQRIENGTVR